MRTNNIPREGVNFSKAFQLIGLCVGLGFALTTQVEAQDLKRPPALEIFARPAAIASPVLSASGETAYYISRKGTVTSVTVHDLNAKTRLEIPLTGPERAATGLKLIDETHLAISYGPKMGVSTLDLSTRKITTGGPEPEAREAMTHDIVAKDGRILGQVTHDDWVSYQFSDPELANLPTLAARAFEDYRIRFVDFAEDPRKVVLLTEGDDDAGTYYFVDFARDGFVQLGQTRPDLRPEWITQKDVFDYPTADGQAAEAYLTLPPGREPRGLPLIVIMPDALNETLEDLGFDPFVTALTTRGYAVMQPHLGVSARTTVNQTIDATAFLKGKGVINDKRICVMGTGAGGFAALSAALKPAEYRCVVDIAGISDPKSFDGKPGLGDDTSPLTKAGDITASVLIVHPKDETRVPVSQSRLMAKALKDAGRTVTLVEPQASADAALKSMKLIVDFLLKANAPF